MQNLKAKHKLLVVLAFSLTVIVLIFPVKANPYDFELLMWCDRPDIDDSGFLSFIVAGEIDILCVSSAQFNSDNELIYSFSTAQFDSFKSSVVAVAPDMKFYANIYSWAYSPDITTSENRQDMIDEIEDFITDFTGRFDAIMDDVEVFTGSDQNRWAYLEEASAQIEVTMPYYGWIHYNWVDQTDLLRPAVGLYGSQNYYESEWKSGFNIVRNEAVAEGKTDYGISIMAKEYGDRPQIPDMLGYLEDMIELNGEGYYSLMSHFGVWEYERLTSSEKTAWINFFSGPEPTPTPTPTATPTPTSTPPFIIYTPTPTPTSTPRTVSYGPGSGETTTEGLLILFGVASSLVIGLALFSRK